MGNSAILLQETLLNECPQPVSQSGASSQVASQGLGGRKVTIAPLQEPNCGTKCATAAKWIATIVAVAAVIVGVGALLAHFGIAQIAVQGVGVISNSTTLYAAIIGLGVAGIMVTLISVGACVEKAQKDKKLAEEIRRESQLPKSSQIQSDVLSQIQETQGYETQRNTSKTPESNTQVEEDSSGSSSSSLSR